MPHPATGAEESIQCQLAAETLRSWGRLRMRVTGSSMLPAVRPGDILDIQKRALDQVRRGDIVLFEGYERLVAHRVIAHHGAWLIARGDTLDHPDPPVRASGLLGVVVKIERNGRVFGPSRFGGWGRLINKIPRVWRMIEILGRPGGRLRTEGSAPLSEI